ncbi:MAG: sulfotransferase domain-containing protein [Phycisphaeraceae bacterium]|nr:MAG: sulfotransferase domain-containing protein [Phycisphaeraceae bacterium]
MSTTKQLEKIARRALPPAAARFAKRLAVYPRYAVQAKRCREGFRTYGDRYPQKILFVAGLPKSGTTWLEKMLSSWPGFGEVLIPEVAAHEMRQGGSDRYDIPENIFARFKNMLVLTKMHVHGSEHNARVLREAGVRYVVLFRDLRDVAVSNTFYVRNTPWHPEHPHYAGKDVADCLAVFAERTLEDYANWVRLWAQNADPVVSVILRYEEMLVDVETCLRRVASLFELDASDATIREIAEKNSFSRMSGGRSRGESSDSNFVRKGVAGDWRNHFTPALCDLYKAKIGRFLVDFGYEPDESWSAEGAG